MIEIDSRRRKILDATRNLLADQGFGGLSIRKIANRVGCSIGKIYSYFKNKDDLVHTLIDEGFQLLMDEQNIVAKAVKDPVERLQALCRAYFNFARKYPKYYEIMFMLKADEMARYPAEKYRKARKSLQYFADALQAGTEQGSMKVNDFYQNANLLWAFLHGAVSLIHAERLDKKIDPEEFLESTILIATGHSSVHRLK